MNCPQCQTDNSTDNKFCRECGTSLVPTDAAPSREAMMRRQAKVAELLADALRLRDKGLYKEALPFAEQASRLMPDSVRAFAMLTSLHEHLGEWEQAVAAMERIVALNPDSIADREQLAELRRRAHLPTPLAAVKVPDVPKIDAFRPYLPLVLAGAVAGIVFFSLLPLVARKAPAPKTSNVMVTQAETPAATTFDPVTPLKQSFPPPADAPADPFQRQRPMPVPSAPVNDTPNPSGRDDLARVRPIRRPVPTPIPFTAIPPMPVAPPSGTSEGNTAVQGTEDTADNASGDNTFGNGGRITVRPPATNGNTTNSGATPVAAPTPQGYIYIKVRPAPASSKDEPKDEGGRTEGYVPPATDSNALMANRDMERARFLQGNGHYAEAIRAYRDALSGGARGEAYQGIAQSYQRIGDNESARNSYRDAIRAYEQDRSTRPRLAQQGIATCEAALSVLGGQ